MGVEEEEVVEEEGELVLNPEDTQMVASLTERLVRSIRVEQSVVRNNNFPWLQFTKKVLIWNCMCQAESVGNYSANIQDSRSLGTGRLRSMKNTNVLNFKYNWRLFREVIKSGYLTVIIQWGQNSSSDSKINALSIIVMKPWCTEQYSFGLCGI